MTLIAALRHGPTAWSSEKRLQGRADPGLSPAGRAAVSAWRLPPCVAGWRWLTSPLARARETAALLGCAADIEPLLTEMDWGAWEGRTVAELRAELGAEMAGREALGLDLAAPGGERPREVQARLRPLLQRLAAAGEPSAMVTHKGVIRALYASATGWDMRGRAPDRLRWDALQVFRLDADGRPAVERLNVALAP